MTTFIGNGYKGSRTVLFYCLFFVFFSFTKVCADSSISRSVEDSISSVLDSLTIEGFPFAKVRPQIDRHNNWSIEVDSGPQFSHIFIKNINPELRGHLFNGIVSPFRRFSTLNGELEHMLDYVRSINFVDSARLYTLYSQNDTLVVPLSVSGRKDFFLNGVIGYSNKGTQGVVGDFSVLLLNTFGIGEEFSFHYRGDKIGQEIGGEIALPYILSIPLLFRISGDVEVSDGQGFTNLYLSTEYRLPSLQDIGIGYRYYNVKDSVQGTKFNGVDLFWKKRAPYLSKGMRTFHYGINIASGVRKMEDESFYLRGTATLGAQIPIKRFALTYTLGLGGIEGEVDSLKNTEKFRLGGFDYMRGYREKELPALGYLYVENSFRYYIENRAAIYITHELMQAAKESYDVSASETFYNYGIGFTYPLRKMAFSIEFVKAVNESFKNARLNMKFTKR